MPRPSNLNQRPTPSNLPDEEDRRIFLFTHKNLVDEHKVWEISRSNTLSLVSTNEFEGMDGGNSLVGGNTVTRLGNTDYLVFFNWLWRSRDNAKTWEIVLEIDASVSQSWGMAIDSTGRIWFVNEFFDTGTVKIVYSDDDGDNWEVSVEDLTDISIWSLNVDPNNDDIIIGHGWTWSNGFSGILYTTDRGENWDFFEFDLQDPGFFEFDVKSALFLPSGKYCFLSQDTLSVVGDLIFYYSEDPTSGQNSFTQVVIDNEVDEWEQPIIALSYENGRLYAFAGKTAPLEDREFNTTKIFVSLDEGETWELLDPPIPASGSEHINITSGFYDGNRNRLIVISEHLFIEGQPREWFKVWVSQPPGSDWIEITPEEELSRGSWMSIWLGPNIQLNKNVNRPPST